MKMRLLLFFLFCTALTVRSQTVTISGTVADAETGESIEFASVLLDESGLWAVTGEGGRFTIKGIPTGKNTVTVQCLGYQKRSWPMTITRDVTNLTLRLKEENLKLDEVTIVA